MPVSVPATGRQKVQRESRFAALACGLCLAVLVGCSPVAATPSVDDPAAAGGITVTIDTPTEKDVATPYNTSIVVQGKYVLDKGVSLDKDGLTVSLGDKLTAVCTVAAGGKYSCALNPSALGKDGKPLFACNESAALTVTATGTQSGAVVGGSASLQVEIDNCAPVISLSAATQTSDGSPARFVGTEVVHVLVTDTRLQTSSLDVVNANGDSILATGPVVMPAGNSVWKFDYTVDAAHLADTQKLTVVVKAKDENNDEVQATLELYSVKSALFLGRPNDEFHTDNGTNAGRPGLIADFVMLTSQEAPDGFVAFTTDPTPTSGLDKLTDAVIAAEDGVYVRAGMPKRNDGGHPIDAQGQELTADADTHLHALQFENATVNDPLSKYRAIHQGLTGGTGTASVKRVFVRDLDGDGDLDIIAVVATGTIGEAWAILNVPATIAKSTVGADGKAVDQSFTIRAFKVVDTMPLPALPSTAELADLNNDGLDDLLIGALPGVDADKNPQDLGLMTLLLSPGPTCQTPSDSAAPTKACGDPAVDYATVKSANIFNATVRIIPHPGVTQIVTIAAADFFSGDGIDVCVGSSHRPIISCFRNTSLDGDLIQAEDGFLFSDATDVRQIRIMDMTPTNTLDGPDLIVASSSGHFLRWLKGDHKGHFTYFEDSTAKHRSIPDFDTTDFTIAPVGPKGESYVIAGTMEREVQFVPLDTADVEYQRACFRTWIVGQNIKKLDAKRVDTDNVLDLINADSRGLQIAQGSTVGGKFTGGFVAPTGHHMCAAHWPAGGRGIQELVAAKVADFNKDQKKELLVVGKLSKSDQLGSAGLCENEAGTSPLPVWPFAVFMNDGGQLNPEPRQTEFSPYHPTYSKSAGLISDCASNGIATFGQVAGIAVEDVNADGLADLVTIRSETGYSAGEATTTSKICSCLFDEKNEVSNDFGMEEPAGDSPDVSLCCSNFYVNDVDKVSPLQGFGGGAPHIRASAHVFLSSVGGPLGMKPNCNALPPQPGGNGICVTGPAYAFSAGRNPVDVKVVDVDGDKKPDIVTAMASDGASCYGDTAQHYPYLQARTRVFQNKGNGVFAPTTITDSADKLSVRDKVLLTKCTSPSDFALQPVTYRIMPEALKSIEVGPWPNPKDGKLDIASIFGLGQAYGQIGLLPHLEKFNYVQNSLVPMGGVPDSFNAKDVNGDGISDLLVLADGGKTLMILTGKINNGNAKDAAFQTQTVMNIGATGIAVAAAMGDVNHDGFLDVVLVRSGSWTVDFLLGTGDGGFMATPGAPIAPGAVALEVTDLDGDSCDDIIVRSAATVTILSNQGASLADCAGAQRWAHEADLAPPAP